MATVPDTEPSSFRAGDFLTWEKDLADYPANAGWSLAYTLRNSSANISIPTTASGAKHLVSMAPSTTAAWAAGRYELIGRVTKGTEIYSVFSGTIQLLKDVLGAFDFRSHARKMLEAIEATYEGRATGVQLEYEIAGRRIRNMSPQELIKWRSYYETEIQREEQAEGLARTGINPRRIGVRLTRI